MDSTPLPVAFTPARPGLEEYHIHKNSVSRKLPFWEACEFHRSKVKGVKKD
jgi:hypothetical protein